MRSPHEMQPIGQGATTNIEPSALTEVVVAELPEKVMAVSAGQKLKDKWQLSGVTQWGGSSVLILRDRIENTSRRINEDVDLDGWIVRGLGPDYAVFAQNGEEVRLILDEHIEY